MKRRRMKVKPIKTTYARTRFRSRLEARWALFFNLIGRKWEYEPYTLMRGRHPYYLPDFKLQVNNGESIWVEVKPSPPIAVERNKAYRLCKDRKETVLVVYGSFPFVKNAGLRSMPHAHVWTLGCKNKQDFYRTNLLVFHSNRTLIGDVVRQVSKYVF